MTRHWSAFVATITVALAAAPAVAQDRPPPPAWADPQGPDQPPMAGAPFVPPPPMVYPLRGPVPFPPGPMPVPPPGVPGPDFAYHYGGAAAPCGCGVPTGGYVWVPVQIRTNYVYSAAIEHVREVPEERVVYHEVTETRLVRARGKGKYVKVARPAKLTKGKTIRTTK